MRTTLRALALRLMDQGQATRRWAASLGFQPRQCGRSASGISMVGWTGHCLMPLVQARLRPWISNNSSALSPEFALRLQRGVRAGRYGC